MVYLTYKYDAERLVETYNQVSDALTRIEELELKGYTITVVEA